jgi:hypothetical protein
MADLITLEDYKEAKGLTKTDDDIKLTSLVASVSQLVKTYCANSFVDYYSSDKTDILSIDYATHIVQVSEAPIVSITSVSERANYGSDYTVLTEAAKEFFVDNDSDTLYRTSSTGFVNWPQGPGGVKIIYKAGYSTLPLDLKLAVVDLITYYKDGEYKERRTLGSASIANNPTSTQLRNVGFPDHIKRILDLHKHIQL